MTPGWGTKIPVAEMWPKKKKDVERTFIGQVISMLFA